MGLEETRAAAISLRCFNGYCCGTTLKAAIRIVLMEVNYNHRKDPDKSRTCHVHCHLMVLKLLTTFECTAYTLLMVKGTTTSVLRDSNIHVK